jgi:hypothetical protein
VDKWPAAARLWTVATAGHLPTAIIHHDWGHGRIPACASSAGGVSGKGEERSSPTDFARRFAHRNYARRLVGEPNRASNFQTRFRGSQAVDPAGRRELSGRIVFGTGDPNGRCRMNRLLLSGRLTDFMGSWPGASEALPERDLVIRIRPWSRRPRPPVLTERAEPLPAVRLPRPGNLLSILSCLVALFAASQLATSNTNWTA